MLNELLCERRPIPWNTSLLIAPSITCISIRSGLYFLKWVFDHVTVMHLCWQPIRKNQAALMLLRSCRVFASASLVVRSSNPVQGLLWKRILWLVSAMELVRLNPGLSRFPHTDLLVSYEVWRPVPRTGRTAPSPINCLKVERWSVRNENATYDMTTPGV